MMGSDHDAPACPRARLPVATRAETITPCSVNSGQHLASFSEMVDAATRGLMQCHSHVLTSAQVDDVQCIKDMLCNVHTEQLALSADYVRSQALSENGMALLLKNRMLVALFGFAIHMSLDRFGQSGPGTRIGSRDR